jgi:hypothetical protein
VLFDVSTRWDLGRADGRIAFDHGAATIKFGAALEEAEAEELVERLRRRLAGTPPATAFPVREKKT